MRLFTKIVALSAILLGGFGAVRVMKRPDTTVRVGSGSMRDIEVRNRDIAFYQARLARDPSSAGDLAQLAGLYLQRAREAGDYEDLRRGERAARQSVALRTSRNGKAQMLLASSLLAQHRFSEARVEAEKLVARDSSVIGYRALLAEIQMELADYPAAERSFQGLAHASEQLAVATRLARWKEIHGDAGAAKLILKRSLEAARTSHLPNEQIAWFYLRYADFSLRYGATREAERAFKEGLRYEPNDFRLISGLARVEFARANYREAISYALLAGKHADLATLSLLADSYAALGHKAEAEGVCDRIARAAAKNPEPFNRQWTQFLLDHKRALPETRATLEREIAIRPDVLGYDQLAWSYYLTGDNEKANRTVDRALQLGTRDAGLYFRAGEIKRSVGNLEAARAYYKAALQINPRFHPLHSDTARSRLESLAR